MPRVRSAVARQRKKKRIFRRVKGFVGGRRKLWRTAKESSVRAEAYATEHRRQRKGEMRRLWIVRINAACRARGLRYSEFIAGLKKANVELDRKALSELAIHNEAIFDQLVEQAKSA